MELIKKNIHMEHQINLGAIQIALEEDQNISDQKPDALKIVCKNAEVRVEEIKPMEEAVWVKGTLDYNLLYLTDEMEKELCDMDGKIRFEEKVYTQSNVSGDGMRVYVKPEDLSIRLINSRKMNIRAVIGLELKQDKLYDEEIIVDVEEPKQCEILKKPLDVTAISVDTEDIYRVREEVQIPDGLPNIYKLLWKDIRAEGLTFTPMEGRIGVSGELNMFFLYEGEEEETTPRCFEVRRPFGGTFDVSECREGMLLWMDYETEKSIVEVKPDYDGEEREIDVEVDFRFFIKLYNNYTVPYVADAYGIRERLLPVMKEAEIIKLSKCESGKIKISDFWENTEEIGGQIQLLHAGGDILEEKVTVKENELCLHGLIRVSVLCMLHSNAELYRCITLDIPYEHNVSFSGRMTDVPCRNCVCIDQVNAVVQGDRVEARVLLSYRMLVYDNKKISLLSDVKRAETESEERIFPVMAVYFAKENESVWEVGKQYQVSLDSIREINQLTMDELQSGQKLLVVKEMD